jgi:cohesin complex subunit SCC1
LDWGTQSLITESLDLPQTKKPALLLQDDDLYLDQGDNDDLTLEVGRRAATPLTNARDEPTILQDDDIHLDFGNDMPGIGEMTELPTTIGADNDVPMDDLQLETTLDIGDLPAPAQERNTRRETSLLSEPRASQEPELEQSFRPNETTVYDETDDMIVAAQRVKRRKVIQMDSQLEISSATIKQQQLDHSRITKEPQFLPRDPLLLQLLQMQKNGGFVSSIFSDGRSMGWAPELRGVLSVDVIRSSGDLKRKRDSGVADLFSDEDEAQDKDGQDEEQQQFEDELPQFNDDSGAVLPLNEDTTIGDFGPGSPIDAPNFDDTTMPLLHPADAGPVSTGTKHAVHLLRERFGPEGAESQSHRQKNSVLLQDLVPEKRASRREATRMFFEVLVLATKDAVKVEQESKKGAIGEPIRIRAKRGLYGAWAEAAESQPVGGTQTDGVEAAPAMVETATA